MILQTGMRTDIPAFYSKWFINRIKEGFVLTRNPYNPEQVTKYLINPDVVDIIGFTTKNPRPMPKYMDCLKPYGQYWFVTITPYGKDIEPNVPPKEQVADDFIALSKIVGANSMGWRYDPILINETYTNERHIAEFEALAKKLCGYTHSVVFSFIQIYEKTARNFPEVRAVNKNDRIKLGKELVRIANKYDMVARPCANGDELAPYGADCNGCITQVIYETALGSKLIVPKSQIQAQRKECACFIGRDIGQYNSCPHLCRYCYANTDKRIVLNNYKNHDENSPFLIGNSLPTDKIHLAKQEKWRTQQLSLF